MHNNEAALQKNCTRRRIGDKNSSRIANAHNTIMLSLCAAISSSNTAIAFEFETGGGASLSYPDIIKIEYDKLIFVDNKMSHKIGASAGLAQIGIFYGKFFQISSQFLWSPKASIDYIWQDYSSFEIHEIYKGIHLDGIYAVGDNHVAIPVKVSIGLENQLKQIGEPKLSLEFGVRI